MNTLGNHMIDIRLEALPAYAAFLLSRKLEEFVRIQLEESYSANIPLLKYFENMTRDELMRLSMESNARLLTALRDNNPFEYIRATRENWLKNNLPMISRDQLMAEDITLVSYVRKKAFRSMMHQYTTDPMTMLSIVDDVDKFFLALDSELFQTYLTIQSEKIHEMNQALQKREQQLLEAQSIGRIGSFEWDLTPNKNSYYTPEVFKIFEFDTTSNLEAFMQDVHPDDRLKLKTAIERAMHDGIYECEYRYNRNNRSKVLQTRGRVIFEKGVPVRMIGTVADITEKAKLITQLIESEELAKQAQALTSTGSWKWSIETGEIEWSDEMYRIYGLSPQSEKITFERFVQFIHADDRERRLAEIKESLATGQSSDYVMKVVSNDGKLKILRGKGQVLFDKMKKPVGMLGTCQDITNEFILTEELKKKNAELVRKNRDLESFNFIASHDLQEPLRKIQIYCNRIQNEGGDAIPQKLLGYFQRISSASSRMQRMIADFLTFYQSIGGSESADSLDLNTIVSEIREELAEIIHEKRAVITVKPMYRVHGIRPQIKQMLKHLIENALKFSSAARNPEIVIANSPEVMHDGRHYVRITVRDNGIGFDPRYTSRIFDLFQKLHTNDTYEGSGIGLSLCKKIAEDHHGFISATSEPGNGSEFSVYLPAGVNGESARG